MRFTFSHYYETVSSAAYKSLLVLVRLIQLLKFICLSDISRFEGLNPLLSNRRLHHLGQIPGLHPGQTWETLNGQEKSAVVKSSVQDPGGSLSW